MKYDIIILILAFMMHCLTNAQFLGKNLHFGDGHSTYLPKAVSSTESAIASSTDSNTNHSVTSEQSTVVETGTVEPIFRDTSMSPLSSSNATMSMSSTSRKPSHTSKNNVTMFPKITNVTKPLKETPEPRTAKSILDKTTDSPLFESSTKTNIESTTYSAFIKATKDLVYRKSSEAPNESSSTMVDGITTISQKGQFETSSNKNDFFTDVANSTPEHVSPDYDQNKNETLSTNGTHSLFTKQKTEEIKSAVSTVSESITQPTTILAITTNTSETSQKLNTSESIMTSPISSGITKNSKSTYSSNFVETTTLNLHQPGLNMTIMPLAENGTDLNSNETIDPDRLKLVYTDEDTSDSFWPVVLALTIAIPSVIVFGVTITVLYRRRMAKPRRPYSGDYTNM